MKRKLKYQIPVIIGLLIFSISCQKDEYDLGEIVAPTNVTLSYEIVGSHPDTAKYGDGSGLVNFTATANNAITYSFDFGDGSDKITIASGKVNKRFSITGLNIYTVTVSAIGTGGISSTLINQVEVLSVFEDSEALDFLTGGSSKSWYWAADQMGHLGLGPNDKKYENGEHTYAYWYKAASWEKDTVSSLYDCEFVFSINGNNLTFEHINPTGEAFIQGIYANELGLGEEGSYPFDIGGLKNVSFSPSESIATEDGEYRGTTMTFSDGGFMGFYAGSSQYEIIDITENSLSVRMVQANFPLHAWYHTFTNVKPVHPVAK
jgi:hypothetical protein